MSGRQESYHWTNMTTQFVVAKVIYELWQSRAIFLKLQMTVYFTENYRTPWCYKINIKYKRVYFQTWNSILTFKTQVPYEKPYNKSIPYMGIDLCTFTSKARVLSTQPSWPQQMQWTKLFMNWDSQFFFLRHETVIFTENYSNSRPKK